MKNIFRKRKSRKKLMSFDRSPRLSGKVDVLFGVPLAALWTLRCYMLDNWTSLHTIFTFVILAWIIGSGVYCWAFRKGAVSDTVTLGGFADRMYHRFKRRYIPYGIVGGFAAYCALCVILTLIDNSFKALPLGELSGLATTLAWILLLTMHDVWKSYIDLYEYYRSPEASHKYIDWY